MEDFFQTVEYGLRVKRFGDVVISARLDRIRRFPGPIGCRHHDDIQILVVSLYPSKGFEAVHPRHDHVQKDQIEDLFLNSFQGAGTVGYAHHIVVIFQNLFHRFPRGPVVVHYENS